MSLRSPFAGPDEYHHFPTSDGMSARATPPDTIKEGLVLRTPVMLMLHLHQELRICFPFSSQLAVFGEKGKQIQNS